MKERDGEGRSKRWCLWLALGAWRGVARSAQLSNVSRINRFQYFGGAIARSPFLLPHSHTPRDRAIAQLVELAGLAQPPIRQSPMPVRASASPLSKAEYKLTLTSWQRFLNNVSLLYITNTKILTPYTDKQDRNWVNDTLHTMHSITWRRLLCGGSLALLSHR